MANIDFCEQIKRRIENNSNFGEYFKNDQNPTIIIKNSENVIKLVNITFKDNHGNQLKIIANHDLTINRLLNKYCCEINIYSKEEEIQFIYNKKNKI